MRSPGSRVMKGAGSNGGSDPAAGPRAGSRLRRSRLHDDLDPAVVGAPLGRRIVGDGPREAESLRRQAICGDTARHEVVANGLRPLLGETLIVVGAALGVGVSLHDDLRLAILLRER